MTRPRESAGPAGRLGVAPGPGAGSRCLRGCSADLGGQRDEGQRASRWLRNMPTVLLPSGGRAACLCLARLASGRGNSAEVPRARKASGSVLALPRGSLGSEKTPPRPVERAAWQGPEASHPPPPRAHVLQADRPALVQPAAGTAPADTRCSPERHTEPGPPPTPQCDPRTLRNNTRLAFELPASGDFCYLALDNRYFY